MSVVLRPSKQRRHLEWIIDGYVLGEYDLFECGARLSRAVASALADTEGGTPA